MDSREYVMDRIKKLTSALYRVTDLLSDREPLKWTLRDKAIDIFNNFLKDRDIILSDIINMLELFSPESSISNLNYNILKKEYEKLRLFIEKNKESLVPNPIEPIEIAEPIGPAEPAEKTVRYKREEGKTKILKENSRKERILELLKDHSPKTISEITPFFEQISEKSIQRDLIDLVKSGRLATEGEKRWRRYKLLTNSQI